VFFLPFNKFTQFDKIKQFRRRLCVASNQFAIKMIGTKITRYNSLESTNNFVAKQLIDGLYAKGEVVLARFQTEGRGQRGSSWQSLPGDNLTFSFALPSNFLNIHAHFILSKAVSVAIYEMLSASALSDVRIKWPNDILVSDHKICGILLETKVVNSEKHTVVGIGLNVNQVDFDPGYKATSIALQLGRPVDLDSVLKELIGSLNQYLNPVLAGYFDDVEFRYQTALYGAGHWIQFSEEHRSFQGQIKEVDNEGVILVKSKQGQTQSYRAKEVKISY